MFSATALFGLLSVIALLLFAAYFLRELGAADLAAAMLGVAVIGAAAALLDLLLA